MPQSNEFIFATQTPWEDVGPGLKRQLLGHDGNIMLVKVAFEVGAIGEAHSHPHTQVSYVESGEFEMTIGEQKHIIRQGDSYFIPPHVVHGCVCLKEGVLVDAFTPAREDFL